MPLISQAIEAAKSKFSNGDIKMFVYEMLSLGYQSYLCKDHLSTVVKYVNNSDNTDHVLLIVVGKCQVLSMTHLPWTPSLCGSQMVLSNCQMS